ncbi:MULTISPECIES: Crp/Fnr family transcriptional regulator [Bacillus]|uniref:Crp/Fnr family transcriptional regulator n=1 Tax=Bacillus TaxID=1386 RepID=UPI000E358580|nr:MULTISPECIES: Crp/Fnr family transcriptional regulator [Bacillus]HDR4946219.1 Crp/Fnr family transcriptional regulator [Bacillus cereus]AXR16769.1 Crp/Fnr family transcriptional regulator [Bacillus sp. CR71]AXR22501.1 Crp/Fnr family transcriptional regulator [Bacillus sp. E25]MBV6679320.1 Crp/Fnr family transcriptional regulator [Bacillus thuringiensis]MED3329077.1 Crp/Fnr family transcriptional regulator [Bacillus thuringiensis]
MEDRSGLITHYLRTNKTLEIFSEIDTVYFQLNYFEKGELICNIDDEMDRLYFVVKGKVKVYTITSEGKKLILRFINPLAIVGDIELIQNSKAHNVVEACSDVIAISISNTVIRNKLLHDLIFMKFLLENIANTLKISTRFTALNLLYPVEVRVASYLLSISTDSNGNMYKGDLDTTSVTSIADFIGVSYRHVIRVLQRFYNDKLIEKSNGVIVIKDFSRMKEVAKDNIYEQ